MDEHASRMCNFSYNSITDIIKRNFPYALEKKHSIFVLVTRNQAQSKDVILTSAKEKFIG